MKKRPDTLLPVKIQSRREIDRVVRKMQKDKEKAQKDLEARAKPLYELTHEEAFTVEEVFQEPHSFSDV